MTEATAQVDGKIEACLKEVVALCQARGIAVTRLGAKRSGYLGIELQGAVRAWALDVDCAGSSVSRLPQVWLRDPGPLLAHVSYHGSICVNDSTGLSIDLDRPAAVVAYTVGAAYDLLEKSAVDASAGGAEFYNELEGYWFSLPNSRIAHSSAEVDQRARLVVGHTDLKSKSPTWYFTEHGGPIPEEIRRNIAKLAPHGALYLHLDGPVAPPPAPGRLDHTFLEMVRSRLTPPQSALWARLVGPSKNGARMLSLIVSAPRQAGGVSLVGVSFQARGGKVDGGAPITPLSVSRHTATHMRLRGGASPQLLGKHVAVLGCGSVGSEVADALAAAGVGHLTLVDPEVFTQDNVFRHVLDRTWIGAPKALALSFELGRRYPGLRVTEVAEKAEKWLEEAVLANLDGVVVALGLPSLERSLMRRLRGASQAMPLVAAWLEPLDLGGHSVLVSTQGSGCLDCLYRDDEGTEQLSPRTSYLVPGQHVSRDLTGCGSVFVPYGPLQSRRTALMAAEHLLCALDAAFSPSYRFWVGPGVLAEARGLQTTPWWKRAPTVTNVEATRTMLGRPCRHCRGTA